MWVFRWIFGAIIVILILGFALQNQSPENAVSVHFLKWETAELPLYLYLYMAFGIGMLFWTVISMGNIFKLKGEIHKLNKENKKYKEELDRLRNLNIEEDFPPSPQQEENEEAEHENS